MHLAASTIVADKYEIIKPLGEGGMGAVYLARQPELERTVALKILTAAAPDQPEAMERMRREAKIMSSLHHRNLIASYELGSWNGALYLAMEYVEGHPLESELKQKGDIAPKRTLEIARQVAEGLSCAHAHGIVHRDLKPSNILITRGSGGEEVIKVIDFGLAKLTTEFSTDIQKLTETGHVVGTVFYMSPEQCAGRAALDARSDIYGLGAVMYHCLTGAPPFEGDAPLPVMAAHLGEMPKPITGSDIPSGLASVIARCLAKNPDERYQNADELIAALNVVADGRGHSLGNYKPSAPALSLQAASERRKASKKKLFFAGLGTALAALILFVSIQYFQQHPLFQQKQQQSRIDEAEAIYKEAVAQNPSNPDFRNLAIYLNSVSMQANPVRVLPNVELAELTPRIRSYDDLYLIIDEIGKLMGLKTFSNAKPLRDFAVDAKVDLLLQKGMVKQAKQMLEKRSLKTISSTYLQAQIAFLEGQYQQALDLYTKVGKATDIPLLKDRCELGIARCTMLMGKRVQAAAMVNSPPAVQEDDDTSLDRLALLIFTSHWTVKEKRIMDVNDSTPMSVMTRVDVGRVKDMYAIGDGLRMGAGTATRPYGGEFVFYH